MSDRPVEQKGRGTPLWMGIAGGVEAAIAAGAMFVHPGTAAGVASSMGDALILVAVLALWRRGRNVAWLRAAAGLIFSLFTGGLAAASPTVSVGPLFDLFGRLSWLGDAGAYALLGVALLRSRADGPRGWTAAAGVACLGRCAAALLLVGRPSQSEETFNWVHPWQIAAIASGALLAACFAGMLARTRGHASPFVNERASHRGNHGR
jgi:hypothetical protein